MFGLWIITQECRIVDLIKMTHYGLFLFALPCKAIHLGPVQGSGKSYSLGQRKRQWLDQEEKMLQTSFKKT
jgi:hypothetical protein